MLKGLVNKVLKIVFAKILIVLEEVLNADLDGDGKIGDGK